MAPEEADWGSSRQDTPQGRRIRTSHLFPNISPQPVRAKERKAERKGQLPCFRAESHPRSFLLVIQEHQRNETRIRDKTRQDKTTARTVGSCHHHLSCPGIFFSLRTHQWQLAQLQPPGEDAGRSANSSETACKAPRCPEDFCTCCKMKINSKPLV